ncbi:MAG: hypothetical protein J7527_11110, partial [Chitinophagaceae bacterium]|nr:hypothetical protein [Chitinophagaceae bacterium]
GAVAGVIIAFVSGSVGGRKVLDAINTEHGLIGSLGENGYYLLGVLFFAAMSFILYRVATQKDKAQGPL